MPSNSATAIQSQNLDALPFQLSLLRMCCHLSADANLAGDEKLSRQVEELSAYVR